MTFTQAITTARQLLKAAPQEPCELVRGKLIMMSPAGFRHGRVACTVAACLRQFVAGNGLGVVTGAETGFQIEQSPDTVRAADVSFVRRARLPDVEPTGYFPGAPDLAVEVLSPNDRASDVLAKVQDWLGAGASSVWLVDPQTRTVSIYRPDGQTTVFTAQQTLEDAELLPGFQVRVAELLD